MVHRAEMRKIMTLMTEKDKKLIIVTAVVLGIVLVAFLVIWPLVTSNKKISEEITQQELEKQEKELKVAQYPGLLNQQKEIDEKLNQYQVMYFPLMRSVETDKFLTELLLAKGIRIENMQIQMPDTEEYCKLADYPSVIAVMKDANEQEKEPFDGVYAARVSLNLEGSREALQQALDELVHTQPKLRIVNFSWHENKTADSSPYSLSLTVDLYMCEDVDAYIAKQLEIAAKEAAAAAAEATEEPEK